MEFRSNWYAFISCFWDPLFQIQFPVDQCRVFIAFWYWGAILLYWYRLWVLSFNREPFPEIKQTTIILAWLSFIQATTVALVSHSRCQYPASRSYTFTFFSPLSQYKSKLGRLCQMFRELAIHSIKQDVTDFSSLFYCCMASDRGSARVEPSTYLDLLNILVTSTQKSL